MVCGGASRRRAAAAALVVVSSLAVARGARADDGVDTVFLKSGGVVRGAVMEYDPGSEARVKLADGSVRTIAAGLIDRVAMAERTAPLAVAQAQVQGPTGQLHVDGPLEVEIVGRPNEGYEWTPICRAPCDRTVHLDWEYSARGAGVRASAPFQLSGSDGAHVAVAVDPASSTWFVLGVVSAASGGVVTIVGLYVMLIGSLVQSLVSDGDGTGTQSGGILEVGGVVTAVGVGLLVGGVVAALNNASTHVSLAGAVKDALPVHLPAWRSAEMRSGEPTFPTAVEAPVWTVRF
jgi:hypothetical protein